MASLRARLLVAVLVLAAAGLVLVGAITYAEQRSFQLEQVDDRVRAAPPAVARALGDAGVGPKLGDRDRRGGPRDRPPGGGPEPLVPQGTYGERRDASGRVLGRKTFDYGQEVTVSPKLPASVPTDRLLTVRGTDGDDRRYRVYAEPDPAGFGTTTVVAVPLTDVDRTLR